MAHFNPGDELWGVPQLRKKIMSDDDGGFFFADGQSIARPWGSTSPTTLKGTQIMPWLIFSLGKFQWLAAKTTALVFGKKGFCKSV